MTITEKPISGFNTKLKYDKLNYPRCSCNNCPAFYFNMLSVAARQSGKTYTICQLIKHYETHKIIDKDGEIYPLRTILISPTVAANEIYTSLNSLDYDNDVYEEYNDNILLDIIENIKEIKKECEDFQEYKKFYKIFEKTPENKLSQLYDKHPEAFMKLEEQDFKHFTDIPQPRYKNPPVNVVILDDMMCNGAFSNKTKSALTNAFIKNRHLRICFCLLVQSLKSVPKPMRLNSSLFFLGKFQNKSIVLDDIYSEVSNVLTMEQFDQLYTHATNEKYGALILDLTEGKKFLKNFDTELILENKILDNNKEESK